MGGCLSSVLNGCCSEESDNEIPFRSYLDDNEVTIEENAIRASSNDQRSARISFIENSQHLNTVHHQNQNNAINNCSVTVRGKSSFKPTAEYFNSNFNNISTEVNSDYDTLSSHLNKRKINSNTQHVPFPYNNQNKNNSDEVRAVGQVHTTYSGLRTAKSEFKDIYDSRDKKYSTAQNGLSRATYNSNANSTQIHKTSYSAQGTSKIVDCELDNDPRERILNASNIYLKKLIQRYEIEYSRSDLDDNEVTTEENAIGSSSNDQRSARISFIENSQHLNTVHHLNQNNVINNCSVTVRGKSSFKPTAEYFNSNFNNVLTEVNSDYDTLSSHLNKRKINSNTQHVPFPYKNQYKNNSDEVRAVAQVHKTYSGLQTAKSEFKQIYDSRDKKYSTAQNGLSKATYNSNANSTQIHKSSYSAQGTSKIVDCELDNDPRKRILNASVDRTKHYDGINIYVKRLMQRYDPEYFSEVYSENSIPISDNIESSDVYRIIPVSDERKRMIKKNIINKRIIVDDIEEVENEYLKRSYNLKKQQKLNEYPDVQEIQLFHGTKWEYVDSICKNNFNWRLQGRRTGNIFGQGVCFSGNAMYAAHYSGDDVEKVMLVANVLIGKKCKGTKRMRLPIKGYDTSAKNPEDNIVIVKYEDNEFYPIYRIRFHLLPPRDNIKKTTQKNTP